MRASNGWIVDASVALKWYFRDEEFLPQADSLLEALSSGGPAISAPNLICYEMANAFLVAQRQGRLSSEQLLHRLQAFLDLGIARPLEDRDILFSAIELAGQIPVAFYDALYLALAQRLNHNFVTADQRLYQQIKDKLPWVVWIGDLEAKG